VLEAEITNYTLYPNLTTKPMLQIMLFQYFQQKHQTSFKNVPNLHTHGNPHADFLFAHTNFKVHTSHIHIRSCH
jgi:hypothetical protein